MKGERGVKALGRAVEGRLHPEACDELRKKVFVKIETDVSVRAIRFDWLVIAYANDLCLNHDKIYQHGYIRGKLRAAANLLVASKSISSNVSDFSSLYDVQHCNTLVEAIRIVAKFNRQSKRFGSPGTAATSITLINTIGELLSIEYAKLKYYEKEDEVERFLKVFKKEVRTKINKLVVATQSQNRRGKNENIPTTDDVNKLASFLDSERDKYFNQLTQKYSYKNWLKLNELTLASILVFNRRRTGEMRNIIVDQYNGREIIAAQCSTLLDTLPDQTKDLIKSRMKTRGKLDRTVPILLKHSLDECLEVLIRHRKDAGIPDSNEFLFALPSESGISKTIDACSVIRSFSNACGATNPTSLRGTNLRKHMASFCATMNLTDNDVTNLANFMGHDDKIHRDIYRHNALDREVAQMSFLLNAAQGNGSDSSDSSEDEAEEVTPKNVKRKSIPSRNKGQKLSEPVKKKKIVATKKKVVGRGTSKKRESNGAPSKKRNHK